MRSDGVQVLLALAAAAELQSGCSRQRAVEMIFGFLSVRG